MVPLRKRIEGWYSKAQGILLQVEDCLEDNLGFNICEHENRKLRKPNCPALNSQLLSFDP